MAHPGATGARKNFVVVVTSRKKSWSDMIHGSRGQANVQGNVQSIDLCSDITKI